ncbi:hypothetical protein [uncultured Butyricimonas sp.]|mgnify:CR=1 FL=1|uniref:hypothetical protein n=1 Tax=uncultured Butyricimonas sp. TaxID=1268785 RepID=UPI0026DB8615|nr:hypothetical protein [uncultured Butyricimonas sp.]
MLSIFDYIAIDNTYELFFPKKEQGLAIIWLYERVRNGYFDKGVFKEKDIRKAFDEASTINKEKRERQEWKYYNSQIMALQEFFLLYDEENQTYTFKEYASYLCDKVFKMLSNRFNPTVIEITCANLYENLKDITEEKDLTIWLEAYFDKAKLYLKEQIDYLNQQIDKSVAELSEKAKLNNNNSLVVALRDIESKLDEIRKQNGELRGAFREIDRIKSILMVHPARENAEIDDKVSDVINYFESVRTLLNMVDSRIDKIQPKIQQFFGSLNRHLFDTKVEKFLTHLLDKSQVVLGELIFPIVNESFVTRFSPSNFVIIERRDELFTGKRNLSPSYINDPIKEAAAYQQSNMMLVRQSHINQWLEKIKRESRYVKEYHLSDIFFKILELHNEDLQLAVSIIYQAIEYYDRHNGWQVMINPGKMIQEEKYKYTIWDIWMKQK